MAINEFCVPVPSNRTMGVQINEMHEWCRENVHFVLEDLPKWDGLKRDSWEYRDFCFYFANEKYATLFTLRWS